MRRLFPQYDQFILGEVRQVHLFVVFTQPEDILDAAPQLSGLINARFKGDGIAGLEHGVRGAVGQRQRSSAQQADAVSQSVPVLRRQVGAQRQSSRSGCFIA